MLGRHSFDIWNIVPLCLMWVEWRERNSHTLEDKEKSESQLLDGLATSLFEWSRVWGFTFSISVLDFISLLSPISDTSCYANL
jgi:hypothetical protein